METKQTTKTFRHIQLNLSPEVYKEFGSNCVEEDTNMRAKLLTLIAAYNEEKKNKESKGANEPRKHSRSEHLFLYNLLKRPGFFNNITLEPIQVKICEDLNLLFRFHPIGNNQNVDISS